MTEEARKARAEYQRAWRKNNPDKEKRYHETYWERRAAGQVKRSQRNN